MAKHECVIGLIGYYDDIKLTTLSGLKDYIQTEIIAFNEICRKKGLKDIQHKEWTLKDYTDKRKSTNLTRFDYCPECGKRIDWAAIRRNNQ